MHITDALLSPLWGRRMGRNGLPSADMPRRNWERIDDG
jgi:hypothetical protein